MNYAEANTVIACTTCHRQQRKETAFLTGWDIDGHNGRTTCAPCIDQIFTAQSIENLLWVLSLESGNNRKVT